MFEFLSKVIEETYNSTTSVGNDMQDMYLTPTTQKNQSRGRNQLPRRNDSFNSNSSRISFNETVTCDNASIITPASQYGTSISSLTSPSSTINSNSPRINMTNLSNVIDNDNATWTSHQYKKIVTETRTLEDAIGRKSCCKKNCVFQFSLEEIKNKRFTFHHLNNHNKKYHLNLCRIESSGRSKQFTINGKDCCVECVTKVFGISRNFIYTKQHVVTDAPLSNKTSKISVWLMDIANYADRMPDNDELHIPFVNKVIIFCY